MICISIKTALKEYLFDEYLSFQQIFVLKTHVYIKLYLMPLYINPRICTLYIYDVLSLPIQASGTIRLLK